VLQGNASKWQMESQTITQGGAVAFLVIASGSLLLLYFFLDTAFYVMLVCGAAFRLLAMLLASYCLVLSDSSMWEDWSSDLYCVFCHAVYVFCQLTCFHHLHRESFGLLQCSGFLVLLVTFHVPMACSAARQDYATIAVAEALSCCQTEAVLTQLVLP